MLNAVLTEPTCETIVSSIEAGIAFLDLAQKRDGRDEAFWSGGAAEARTFAATALCELRERSVPHEIFGMLRVSRDTLTAADQALCSLYGCLYYLLNTQDADNPLWREGGEGQVTMKAVDIAWKQCFYARRSDLTGLQARDAVDPIRAIRQFLMTWMKQQMSSHSAGNHCMATSTATCSGCTNIEHVQMLLFWLASAESDGRLPADRLDKAEEAIEHVADRGGDYFASSMVDQLERAVLAACRRNRFGLEPEQLLRAIAHLATERLNDGRGAIAEAQAA